MSYQPQTEAATSRFLNVEEAGKTLRIHFNDCGQGDETVVLLHGSGPGATGWANFSRNIDPLVEAGYRVILLDCPGWGKSDSIVNSGSRSDLNARILKSVVDQLDIAKIHLLGNSMGGHSSVAFTLNWPERVGKLVLMGGGTGGMSLFTSMPTEGIKRLNQLYRQPTIENLKLMMDIFVFDTSDLTDALFEARLNNMLSRRDHLENFVKSLEANPKQFPDFGPRLAEIKAQTLIVWGRNDRFVPMDAGLRLLSGIAGSELHIFRDCGHWAQWEHADAFNQLVLHFLALDKMQMGWIFSAGILGLLPGALVGGMLADRYGRKRILIGSVALFGLFSLATAIAWDFPSLVFARLMTGVGLGAALPNLIALTSEAAGPRFRGTAVSLMYCGVPIGAALAATLGFAGANLAWQTVFWVGGVVPLILVPLLMRWLPESTVFAGEKQAAPPLRALFAPETATATLLLWLCYFFTLLVVYMLINWLPLILVEQGFQPSQAAGVMFALQMGAASGTLMLGALMDKLRPVTMSLLIYSGMLASLLALGTVSSFNSMLLAGFVAGLFATGGQSVLYALAPLFYSSQIRATGVGTAVAVGRLGAMSGPLLAGKMLALGTGTVGVMAASAPGILVAGLAVFILMSRRSRMQPCADA